MTLYGSQYLENTIQSADPLGLVRLLYEGAIDSLLRARACLAAGQVRERSAALSKAMEIVLELQSSLNLEQGGEIAPALAQLYAYIQNRLAAANAEQRRAPLDEALSLLMILYDGWKDLGGEPAGGIAAPVESTAPSPGFTL
jgi:flagellar protein FliS